MYMPAVRGGREVRRVRFGPYVATIRKDLESTGRVGYLYVMTVVGGVEQKVCLCVASEVNELHGRALLGDGNLETGGSHFLCTFTEQGHDNFGASDDWADLGKFAEKAIAVAKQFLRAENEPVVEDARKPWWKPW
jgi:hypothetical protein